MKFEIPTQSSATKEDMAEIDKQHIKDLIAQGNRFEAMNIFLQCKFGKTDAAGSVTPKVKHENTVTVVPSFEKKATEDVEKPDESKDNSESDSDVSEGGSESDETSSIGQVASPILHNEDEAFVPEVELKEEDFEVDVETVDSPSENFLPRPQEINQSESTQMMHPQHNMQASYGQMGEMNQFSAPAGGLYGPYCSQMTQYETRTNGANTAPVWMDIQHQSHPHQQQQQQQHPQQQMHPGIMQHPQQLQHPQQMQHQHQQQQQEEEDEADPNYVPRIQRDKETTPADLHKKTRQKFFRDQGRPYVSRATGREVRGRSMGKPCNCKKKCWQKIEHGADEIFTGFWDMGNFDEQNVYLYGNISIKPVSRHYVKGSNRRTYTFTYWCKVRGKHVEVCKEMFMGVHGLQNSRGRIGNLMKQMKEGNLLPKPDQRGKHANRPNKYTEQSLRGAKQHIEAYINRNMTLKKMYRDYYVPWCGENKIDPVSEDKYRRIYSEEYKVS